MADDKIEATIIVGGDGTYTKVTRESGKWAASQPVAAAVVRAVAALAESRDDSVLERIATAAYAELKAAIGESSTKAVDHDA